MQKKFPPQMDNFTKGKIFYSCSSDLLEIRENLQKRYEEEGFSPFGGPSAQFSLTENLMQHK